MSDEHDELIQDEEGLQGEIEEQDVTEDVEEKLVVEEQKESQEEENGVVNQASEEQEEVAKQSRSKETSKPKKAKSKGARVKGIIKLCSKLMDEEKTKEEIEAALTKEYTAAGYEEKTAAGKAHGIYCGQIRFRKNST